MSKVYDLNPTPEKRAIAETIRGIMPPDVEAELSNSGVDGYDVRFMFRVYSLVTVERTALGGLRIECRSALLGMARHLRDEADRIERHVRGKP